MSDRRFFIIVLVAALIIGALPFFLGKALAPAGTEFFGNKAIAPADYSVYYSYISQGAQGKVFMYDAFTSESHTATIFQPVWFVVGLLARLFHLSAPLAFAVARFCCIPLFVWVLWWAARWLWPDNRQHQRIGLISSLAVSGLGGIVTMIGPRLADFPWTYPDLWVSEAFSVLTLWSSAHFLLVSSGIVFLLVAIERSTIDRTWALPWWAAIVGAAVLAIHPFHVVTWLALWVLSTTWRWIAGRRFPKEYVVRWGLVVCMAVPVLLLYGLQLLFDPVAIERATQNINLTATPLFMSIGLGLCLPLAVISAWRRKIKDDRWRFLVLLLVAYGLVAYLPVPFQRRLTQGMILPFAWLSVPMFNRCIAVFQTHRMRVFIASIGVLFLSSSWLYIGAIMVRDYARDIKNPIRMYYIDSDHQQLAIFVRTTDPHQPLLASLIESNVLAGQTAHQVFVGYGVETWDFDSKLNLMDDFYSRMTEAEQRELLQRERLCYVLTSPRTRAKGDAFQPDRWSDMREVWGSGALRLYQTPYCR